MRTDSTDSARVDRLEPSSQDRGPLGLRSAPVAGLLLLLMSGCAGQERYGEDPYAVGGGPLYQEESYELRGGTRATRDILWPFYHEEHDEETGRHVYALRPFIHRSYDDRGEHDQWMGLWPLVWSRKRPDEENHWVLPFYYNHVTVDLAGTTDDDTLFLFPFFWWGNKSGVQEEAEVQGFESDRGPYFAFFPLFGHLKGYFGKDNGRFILFPLYWTSNDGLFDTRGFFFPGGFFEGEGPAKKIVTRAPWYGSSERYGVWDRKHYLWPFLHLQTNDLDTPYPEEVFMLWPFYGQAHSEGRSAYEWLWPIFQVVNDERNDLQVINAPWPLFVRYESPRARGWRLWPLYGVQEMREGYRRDVFLWPIFWRWNVEGEEKGETTYMAAPFLKVDQTRFPDGREASSVRFWPLFDYQRDAEGAVSLEGLEFLPIPDFEPAGFDHLWNPLLRLFSYRTHPDEGTELRLLGPMVEHRSAPGVQLERFLGFQYSHFDLPGYPEEESYSLFGGFFEYGERDGRKSLRFLWLPAIPLGGREE